MPPTLALLAVLTARAQDPQEYPGLLVVSVPPEEVGEFIAGVCIVGHCLLPPPEGTGPYRLIPGRDPGVPDADPPIGPDRGCNWFTNADELEGNFVLVRSGGCTNDTKFFWSRQAGAIGVVLYHDETVGPDDDSTLVNVGWPATWSILIYGEFISRYRGERLLAAHDAGYEVIVEMRLNPDVVAAEPPVEDRPLALAVTPNPTRRGALVRVEAARPVEARVSVHDALGREVAVLHAGPLPAGPSAFRLQGAALPVGVYVVRLVAGEAVAASRVVVLR